MLFTEIVDFAASVYQDQAAQNMQDDLRSTLLAMLEDLRQKVSRNLLLSLSYLCCYLYLMALAHNLKFLRPCKRSLLKILWEKEKMLVISIFIFFPLCFLPFPKLTSISIFFPLCFLPLPKQISIFGLHLFCGLHMFWIWTNPKFCCLVKSYYRIKVSIGFIGCFNPL